MNGALQLFIQALRRASRKAVCHVSGTSCTDTTRGPAEVLAPNSANSAVSVAFAEPRRIVAVTACPTGIARTYMAAEALQQAALALGFALRVETQGAVGAGTPLTSEDIAEAEVVILAVDREVDRARFGGRRVFASPTGPAIVDGQGLLLRALDEARVQAEAAPEPDEDPGTASEEKIGTKSGEKSAKSQTPPQAGPYKHLMTGVSFMLPFAVAGGFLTVLGFALQGVTGATPTGWAATLADALHTMGEAGFALMLPALAGYMAFSIADRPGIAPGMIGGMLCHGLDAGFFGALAAGFVAGYSTRTLNRALRLPPVLAGLKPVIVLPLCGTLVTGLVLVLLVGAPAQWLNEVLRGWFGEFGETGPLGMGILLGTLMALDLGGPLNKAAYAFALGMLETGACEPMAAVMAAGMTPPLAASLATRMRFGCWSTEEKAAGDAALVMGMAFVSEGAIPFAAKDPLRTIPAFTVGSALAGGLTMLWGVQVMVPHGGLFALLVPGAVYNVRGFLYAVVLGMCTSAVLLAAFRRRRIISA